MYTLLIKVIKIEDINYYIVSNTLFYNKPDSETMQYCYLIFKYFVFLLK